jgi:hypothetical protein
MELFHSDSQWKTVAANIRVFKIGPGFAQQGKDDDLRLIFSELKRHNIKLALEMAMATRSEHCQESTEAYGAPGLVEGLLRRVNRLGGDLAYIAMDEPLYYGHQYEGGGACKLSVRQVAADVTGVPATTKRLSSTVFKGAREAMFAVRANKELQCNCSGPVTAIIGKALYHETAGAVGGKTNVHEFPGNKIVVDARGTVYANSPKFPVTPGAAFTLEVPYTARVENEHAAYVAVLFVDDAGHEVGRRFLYIESSKATIGEAETGPDGSFTFDVGRTESASQPQEFHVDFQGDARFRGVAAIAR